MAECAFCDYRSDYVLTVTDSAPEEMQVIDDQIAMPICRPCFDDMKEADMNNIGASETNSASEGSE